MVILEKPCLSSVSQRWAASTRSGIVTYSRTVCMLWSAIPTTTALIPLSLNTLPVGAAARGMHLVSEPQLARAPAVTRRVAGSSSVSV